LRAEPEKLKYQLRQSVANLAGRRLVTSGDSQLIRSLSYLSLQL